jgi:ABC-type spermidine/putrescine transport system permease subunit II
MKHPLLVAVGRYRLPFVGIAVLVAITLMLLPFVVLVATSWSENAFALFPPQGFTLNWYQTVLTDSDWADAFWRSIWISALATAVATVFGVAGALALPRLRSIGVARAVRTLFIAPIALPPVAYAVGLYGVNLNVPTLHGTFTALILGEALLALPYVFVVASASVGRLDPALRPAASTMGAPWPVILLRIELPLILGGVLAGALFAFVTAFDDVVLAVFVAPLGSQTLPLKMLSESQEAVSPELTAASTLVSLLALVVLGATNLILQRRSSAAQRAASTAATATKVAPA